ATKILTNAVGCDSIVTLNLTIHNSNVVTDTHVACDSYTWIDGVTYNSNNNTATKHYTNMNGCDSLVKLNLTINHSTSTIDTKAACNTFTWSNGITYTSSNNTATQMLTTSKGCDSLVTLNLTVNHMFNTTDVETACHSYMWIDGNTYTSNNNTATFAYTTTLGCDSIVTLNLTIKSTDAATILSNFTIIARNNTATYQWINCKDNSIIVGATNQTYTASQNGNYAVIVTENGCSDTSACVAVTTMGLDEFTINSLEIYPNPSKGQFVIETATDVSITISDVSGKLISIQELHAGKNTIDIQGVETGIYLINCTDKSGRSVTKRINIMDI
ncbi:MAG: T9SS type A sorting domain-containing protein, partial [Crocinitomicaceae bacterium]